jgi:NADH dehydrogenase
MHVLATRVVTEACDDAGVKRYIHMSALGVSPEGRAEYQKTKWRAEEVVRRGDLDWTIFRPGLIHGPDGEFVQMMADLASGDVPPYYFMPYFVRRKIDLSVPAGPVEFESAQVQPVAVEDVAAAFVTAISTPASIGEIYNMAGPETFDWPTLLTTFRDVLPGSTKSIKPFFVPGDHGEIIARVAKVIGLAKLLPYDLGQAIMAQEDSMASPEKLQAHLGITPRPFRKTLEAYAAKV